jgi:hypothetical protein
MKMERRQVSTIEELQAAATDADVQQIVIAKPLEGVPTVRQLCGLSGSSLAVAGGVVGADGSEAAPA